MRLDEAFQQRLNDARTLFSAGKPAQAESLYRELLQPDLPAGGNILVLDGLGRCLHAQGRLEEAEELFRQSLDLLEDFFGHDHPHVAGALQNLARLRSERGDRAEAVELGAKALRLLQKQLPPDDPRLADALLNLSSNQYAAKDYDAAEANLNKALHIWEGREGRRSFGVSTCLNNLGRICEERGETAQGVRYHREAVSIRKEILGDHAETAFSLGNYGAALAGDGQWAEAARALEEALACYARIGQADTPDAATCRANLELCRKAAQGAS